MTRLLEYLAALWVSIRGPKVFEPVPDPAVLDKASAELEVIVARMQRNMRRNLSRPVDVSGVLTNSHRFDPAQPARKWRLTPDELAARVARNEAVLLERGDVRSVKITKTETGVDVERELILEGSVETVKLDIEL